MAGAGVRVRVSFVFSTFVVLILLLFTLDRVSSNNRENPRRYILVLSRNDQRPNCREMSSRAECARNAKCRWCRSESIDDMCFSSIEAWRLPQQVFSCD